MWCRSLFISVKLANCALLGCIFVTQSRSDRLPELVNKKYDLLPQRERCGPGWVKQSDFTRSTLGAG